MQVPRQDPHPEPPWRTAARRRSRGRRPLRWMPTSGHGGRRGSEEDQLPALELIDLDKSYGDLHALREMSLTVQSGEIFGFVGSNGAGKTTAMRIAVGVLAADAGQVRWAGEPVDLTVSRRIGYMPEERGLY